MSEKSIVWVHQFGEQMASFRYRALMPAQEVGKINGYKTALNNGTADIVIFSKPIASEIETAEQAKRDGAKIIVDLADDHFTDSSRETFLKFAELADGIVTGTNAMRARIYDHTKRDSVAIPDPYEFPECAPHADGDCFLWFGHQTNLRELISILPHLKTRKLLVVTGPKQIPNAIQWTPQNITGAFAQSSVVLLPTSEGNEHKTANRLLNSIRAGCFPVCMRHPSYLEFQHHVWVGNLPTGLRWVDAFKDDLNELVAEAQNYIRDRYSPATIGQRWADYLESV